jgi:hypothetical protein
VRVRIKELPGSGTTKRAIAIGIDGRVFAIHV